jgi:hypothetical protein
MLRKLKSYLKKLMTLIKNGDVNFRLSYFSAFMTQTKSQKP